MSRVEEALAGELSRQPQGFAVAVGVVTNNMDLLSEGRVQVRITNQGGLHAWARVPSIGGGSGRGFVWVPQQGDEVLVAFAMNDPRCAYIIGGLWSTVSRPPALVPTDFLTKRIVKTGVAGGVGHEVEFDDALQSITITSSTLQKITITPLTIELANAAGTLSISLNNESQSISIRAAQKIDLTASQVAINGASVDIKGGTVNITSTGPCSVTGVPIRLN